MAQNLNTRSHRSRNSSINSNSTSPSNIHINSHPISRTHTLSLPAISSSPPTSSKLSEATTEATRSSRSSHRSTMNSQELNKGTSITSARATGRLLGYMHRQEGRAASTFSVEMTSQSPNNREEVLAWESAIHSRSWALPTKLGRVTQ